MHEQEIRNKQLIKLFNILKGLVWFYLLAQNKGFYDATTVSPALAAYGR